MSPKLIVLVASAFPTLSMALIKSGTNATTAGIALLLVLLSGLVLLKQLQPDALEADWKLP